MRKCKNLGDLENPEKGDIAEKVVPLLGASDGRYTEVKSGLEFFDKIVKVSERRLNPKKWGLVVNKEVSRLFTEPVKPTFDPRKICSACLFMRNNQTVKNMSSPGFKSKTLDSSIEHINFP